MTDNTELIAQLRKQAKYEPICDTAADAMWAARTEVERLGVKLEGYERAFLQVRVAMGLGLHSHDDVVEHAKKLAEQRDAALARIAELEKQRPVVELSNEGCDENDPGDVFVSLITAAAKEHMTGHGTLKLYAAAGANDEIDKLVTALAACRDAFPAPAINTELDGWYVSAIADPLAVPDYIKACAAGASPQPTDPMDWPLPCDVTVGHGTMSKGVKLRTLVLRMKALYELATGQSSDEVASRSALMREGLSIAQPVQPSQAVELSDTVFRDGCKECDREKKARADNKEWQEGVKRGNEIASAMARAAINAKGATS